MDIECLYCGYKFKQLSSWSKPKCPICTESTYLKIIKNPNRGDVFGYRFTENKDNKHNPSTNGYMYSDEYSD